MQGFTVDFCGSKEFAEYGNFFTRVGFYCLTMTSQRAMYYGTWLMLDTSSIASGLSFSGVKQTESGPVYEWDRVI